MYSRGIVDISFEPDQCRNKMQESHETSCEFVIASENASIPLDFVDETFDDVAFSVADSVIVPWLLSIAAGRDDHLYLLGCETCSQRVRIVAFIGNDSIKVESGERRFSLGHRRGALLHTSCRQFRLVANMPPNCLRCRNFVTAEAAGQCAGWACGASRRRAPTPSRRHQNTPRQPCRTMPAYPDLVFSGESVPF